MTTDKDKKNINEYLKKVGIDKQPMIKELKKVLQEAVKDRARIFCFTWKRLQELHPEIDADEVMREASIKFGNFIGSKYKNIKTAKDALIQSSSKARILAFEQEFTELNEDKTVRKIYHFPHVEAFKELGCSNEEIEKLCIDMPNQEDYACFISHRDVKLSFPNILAKGDKCCEMTFDKVEKN